MDCQMPDMDGFQTALEIRRRERLEKRGRIPIIALTTHGSGDDCERCIASGIDDYLAKPFRIAELGRALDRWIGVRESVP
jgi:two-component system, sensor histidine kinase